MTQNDNDIEKPDRGREGHRVVCPEGHIHDVNDLDKHGMDYFCPECFRGVEFSQVRKAERGQNLIEQPDIYNAEK